MFYTLFGLDLGVITCAKGFGEDHETLPLDSERYTRLGRFSFDPLPENSYSKIKDLSNSSIEAIYLIKARDIPVMSEVSKQNVDQWITSKQIINNVF